MQNKKRLHKHLLIIYIIYFSALIISFTASFLPNFSMGWNSATKTINEEQHKGDLRSYYVSAQLRPFSNQIEIPGLSDNISPSIEQINLRVQIPEGYTMGNAFKVMANNGYVYLMMLLSLAAYLTIFVLIALMINSLRQSIREDLPLNKRNISRTRIVGILIIVAELGDALVRYIHNSEAARLLVDTPYEVVSGFPINYWNVIVGVLFLFMAEVFTIGTQLSEEQKYTI